MRAVVRHCWPGNIRELQNYIARGVILSNDGVFEPAPLEKRARREFERLRQTPGRKLSQARAATDHFTKILVAAPFIFLYLNRTLNFENPVGGYGPGLFVGSAYSTIGAVCLFRTVLYAGKNEVEYQNLCLSNANAIPSAAVPETVVKRLTTDLRRATSVAW